MTEHFPKSEQIDTLNGKLDALNETLKKREDFVSAVAKMEAATASAESATTAANTAATNANTAAAGVVSPTASVTKSGTTTTVTVTDKSGTTTAEVKDGSDAAVTKDNIVSALGYEPQKPDSEFELLVDMTFDEDVQSVKITQDKDGNALNLSAVAFIFKIPQTTVQCGYTFDCYDGLDDSAVRKRIAEFNIYNDSSLYYYATGALYKSGGARFAIYGCYLQGNQIPMYTSPNGECIVVRGFGNVKRIKLTEWRQAGTDGYKILAGSTLQIYGIRA